MLFCRPASFLLLSQFYSLFQSTGSHSSTGTVANFPRKRFRTSSLNESVSNECFFPARSRNPSNNLAGTLGHQSETHLGFVLLLFRCCQREFHNSLERHAVCASSLATIVHVHISSRRSLAGNGTGDLRTWCRR